MHFGGRAVSSGAYLSQRSHSQRMAHCASAVNLLHWQGPLLNFAPTACALVYAHHGDVRTVAAGLALWSRLACCEHNRVRGDAQLGF